MPAHMHSQANAPTATTDETGIARAFASGDGDAVRLVFARYGRLVYAVAYQVLGDVGLAEDATQQAFLQAWRAAGTYDASRPLAAWLATIARRSAIDVYRRERRHRDTADLGAADAALIALPSSLDRIDDVWEVRQALDNLPDQDRQLIRLQHFDELTLAEIAARLSIPVGTVKSRSFRAHRRLAGLLAHLRPASERREAQADEQP